MPTDWVYSRRVVNFITRAMIIMQAMAMNTGVGMGMPGMKPPNTAKVGSLSTGSLLPLTQAAMERPAVYIMRVATMG